MTYRMQYYKNFDHDHDYDNDYDILFFVVVIVILIGLLHIISVNKDVHYIEFVFTQSL